MIAIVLAAGKSKRMKSKTPKVLLSILGRPMVSFPISAAEEAGAEKVVVVISKDSLLPQSITGVDFAIQKRARGTGDAVKVGLKKVKRGGLVLILNGDNPLIRAQTIKRMIRRLKTKRADGIILGSILEDPTGYGRIIRNKARDIIDIIEEKNLRKKERSIREVNAGVYIFRSKPLKEALRRIKLDRKKKEYLLTDVLAVLSKMGYKILTLKGDHQDAMGINTRDEFLKVREMMRRRYLQQLIKKGVVIEDLSTVEVEPGTKIDPGVKIGPYVRIKSGTKIRRGTSIGPFTIIGDFDGKD